MPVITCHKPFPYSPMFQLCFFSSLNRRINRVTKTIKIISPPLLEGHSVWTSSLEYPKSKGCPQIMVSCIFHNCLEDLVCLVIDGTNLDQTVLFAVWPKCLESPGHISSQWCMVGHYQVPSHFPKKEPCHDPYKYTTSIGNVTSSVQPSIF